MKTSLAKAVQHAALLAEAHRLSLTDFQHAFLSVRPDPRWCKGRFRTTTPAPHRPSKQARKKARKTAKASRRANRK